MSAPAEKVVQNTLAPEHLFSRARVVDAVDNLACRPPSADSTRGDLQFE
jgi:hypothetical protein